MVVFHQVIGVETPRRQSDLEDDGVVLVVLCIGVLVIALGRCSRRFGGRDYTYGS